MNKEDPTYQPRKNYYERQMAGELDAADCFKKDEKKAKKRKFKDAHEKTSDCIDPRKTKW